MPQLNIFSALFRKTRKRQYLSTGDPEPEYHYQHEFLIFGVPEDRYGYHTVLAFHQPKYAYRKVVATFGRLEGAMANAELVGEIYMRRPYAWEDIERAMKPPSQLPREGRPPVDIFITGLGCAGESLFKRLKAYTQRPQGDDVIPVAVYLAKVRTNRVDLLFDGSGSSLPEGYLTFYTR